jgi:hypothetical protein
MLLTNNSIVYSQTTSDSLKCFTYSEARKIFTDLSRIPHLKGIIVSQDSIIGNHVKLDSIRVDKIDLQTKELFQKDLKIVGLKKNRKVLLIFGGLLGLATQLIF